MHTGGEQLQMQQQTQPMPPMGQHGHMPPMPPQQQQQPYRASSTLHFVAPQGGTPYFGHVPADMHSASAPHSTRHSPFVVQPMPGNGMPLMTLGHAAAAAPPAYPLHPFYHGAPGVYSSDLSSAASSARASPFRSVGGILGGDGTGGGGGVGGMGVGEAAGLLPLPHGHHLTNGQQLTDAQIRALQIQLVQQQQQQQQHQQLQQMQQQQQPPQHSQQPRHKGSKGHRKSSFAKSSQ
jgi:hypothetical protein